MALGDGVLEGLNVPIDQAADILRQPTQPPADPAAVQSGVQQAAFRASLPTFYNEVIDTLNKHRQIVAQQQQEQDQNTAAFQTQQQQQQQVDQAAAQQQQAQQPADQAQQQAAAQQQAQQQQAVVTAAQLPGQQQQSVSSAVPAQPEVPANFAHDPSEFAPATPADAARQVVPGIVTALQQGDLATAQQAASQVTPQQADAVKQISQWQDDQQQQQQQQQLQQQQQQLQQQPGNALGQLGGAFKSLGSDLLNPNALNPIAFDPEALKAKLQTLHDAISAVQQTGEAIPAAPFIKGIEPVYRAVTGEDRPLGNTGGTLGEAIDRNKNTIGVPGTGIKIPESAVGHLATSTYMFAPLGVAAKAVGIPSWVMDAAFSGDAAYQTKPIIDKWQNGEISAQDAVKQIVTTVGPQLAMMAGGHLVGRAGEAGAGEAGAGEAGAGEAAGTAAPVGEAGAAPATAAAPVDAAAVPQEAQRLQTVPVASGGSLNITDEDLQPFQAMPDAQLQKLADQGIHRARLVWDERQAGAAGAGVAPVAPIAQAESAAPAAEVPQTAAAQAESAAPAATTTNATSPNGTPVETARENAAAVRKPGAVTSRPMEAVDATAAPADAFVPVLRGERPTYYGRTWTPQDGDTVLYRGTGQTYIVRDGKLISIRDGQPLGYDVKPQDLHLKKASKYAASAAPAAAAPAAPPEAATAASAAPAAPAPAAAAPAAAADTAAAHPVVQPTQVKQVTAVANAAEAHGDPATAEAIRNVVKPGSGTDEDVNWIEQFLNEQDQKAASAASAASAAPEAQAAQAAGTTGGAKPPNNTATRAAAAAAAAGAGNPKYEPSITPKERMGAIHKIVRETIRQFGLETAPARVRNIIIDATRKQAVQLFEAQRVGRRFTELRKDLGTFTPDDASMPDSARAALKANPDRAEAMAIANPWQFKLNKYQQWYIDQFNTQIKKSEILNQRAGLKIGKQTDDTNYYPRHTISADGKPVVTGASSFTSSRHTGPLEEYFTKNEAVTDSSLALQAHLEGAAITRVQQQILKDMRAWKMNDGMPALKYGSPGREAGYSVVNGMSNTDKFGRQWLARNGEVHEIMTNTFSHGLNDVARVFMSPSRIARQLQFMIGGFHAVFGNISLGATSLPAMLRAIPNEIRSTFGGEAARGAYMDKNTPFAVLFKASGGIMSNEDSFGNGRRIVRAAQTGIPEAESFNTTVRLPEQRFPNLAKPVATVTGLPGAFSQVNHDWLFRGIMPIVQLESFKANLKWLMANKPELFPADFAKVVNSGDGTQVVDFLNSNPKLKSALEKVGARSNHAMGFSETTLGAGEKGLGGGVFNTPTIFRAMISDMRDVFLPPGNIQGALARKWWANTAIGFGTFATAATVAAFKGDYQQAYDYGYLDPTSNKFILNPNNGKYFMAVGFPSGTTLNMLSTPIRTSLRIMTAPAVTLGEDIKDREAPQDIARETAMSAISGPLNFLQNRLGRGLTAAPDLATGLIKQKPTDLRAAVGQYTGGAVPIPLSNMIQQPPTSLTDLKERLIESAAVTGAGAQLRQATAYDNYNSYINSLKNPDGSPKFPQGASGTPSGILNAYVQTDPEALARRDAWQAQQRATGSDTTKQSRAIQDDRDLQLKQAQTQFSRSGDYLAYRKLVDQIRASHARQLSNLDFPTSSNTPSATQQLVSSWYDLTKQATDSSGALHSNDFIDPLTGIESPGLDALQEQWKSRYPGEYASLIEPNYEGGALTGTERQLRVARQQIADSGWWQADQTAWNRLIKQIPNQPDERGLNVHTYKTMADYSTAAYNWIVKTITDANPNMDVDMAHAIATRELARDGILKSYGQLRKAEQYTILQAHPGLVNTLARWKYTNPDNNAIAIGLQQSQAANP